MARILWIGSKHTIRWCKMFSRKKINERGAFVFILFSLCRQIPNLHIQIYLKPFKYAEPISMQKIQDNTMKCQQRVLHFDIYFWCTAVFYFHSNGTDLLMLVCCSDFDLSKVRQITFVECNSLSAAIIDVKSWFLSLFRFSFSVCLHIYLVFTFHQPKKKSFVVVVCAYWTLYTCHSMLPFWMYAFLIPNPTKCIPFMCNLAMFEPVGTFTIHHFLIFFYRLKQSTQQFIVTLHTHT